MNIADSEDIGSESTEDIKIPFVRQHAFTDPMMEEHHRLKELDWAELVGSTAEEQANYYATRSWCDTACISDLEEQIEVVQMEVQELQGGPCYPCCEVHGGW